MLPLLVEPEGMLSAELGVGADAGPIDELGVVPVCGVLLRSQAVIASMEAAISGTAIQRRETGLEPW